MRQGTGNRRQKAESRKRKKIFVCLLPSAFCLLISIAYCLLPIASVWSQVQLVTLPKRDAVQTIIYSSADLTLVKEERKITLSKGLNRLEFNWADTLIDPTSIQLKALDHPESISVRSASFSAQTSQLLQWEIASQIGGVERFEVAYFISGLSWQTNYIGIASADETKLDLDGYITTTNRSGEDFENAQIRLIVGDVHLVEEVRPLAEKEEAKRKDKAAKQLMMRAPESRAKAAALGAEFDAMNKAEEAGVEAPVSVSDYYMYSLKESHTIEHNSQKRLASFSASETPIEVIYRFNRPIPNRVARFYKFKNDEKHNLGKEPLAPGQIWIYRRNERGELQYLSRVMDLKFIAKGGEVELSLGDEPEVKVEKKLVDYLVENLRFNKDAQLIGKEVQHEVKFEIQNFQLVKVKLELFETFSGQWEILSSSHKYEPVDANTVKFALDVPANGAVNVTYKAKFQQGRE